MEIVVKRRNGEFELHSSIEVSKEIDEVFSFFSDARNLESLTPNFLRFNITTAPKGRIQKGSIIEYRLRVHGIPIFWRTRITGYASPTFFRDEQVRGPYRYWVHEHYFEKTERGTKIIDFVRYQPFGGRITNYLFVQRDVESIFRFRQSKLLEIFETSPIS
jgi:ligand-binding SRPBCC domain-containing protein